MASSSNNQGLADWIPILAPTLYLLNLLLFPGIAFLILSYLYIKYKNIPESVARIQIQQNFFASIVSGLAILGISLVIILIGGFSSMYSWMVMLIYALSIHATLVLFGAFSLARGLNHQAYMYPGLSRLSKDKSDR